MSERLPPDVIGAATTALRPRLGKVSLEPLAPLGGSDRSQVWRMAIRGVSGEFPATVVLKSYSGVDAAETWARESVALRLAAGMAPVPELLALVDQPPLLVLTDLGAGPSVADALLGPDPSAAQAAVMSWVDSLALLHTATLATRDEFAASLADRGQVSSHAVPGMLDRAARMLSEHLAGLGLTIEPAALTTLRDLATDLDDGPRSALSPGDTCPDNNVMRSGRLQLLDFEWAEHRHIAWDAAYLLVPWPSCWCSWRLPDQVAAAALQQYRDRMAPSLAYVTTAEFDADLQLAMLGWTLVSTAWFLGRALAGDPPPAPPAPHRRALILYRLALAGRLNGPEELRELAVGLTITLRQRWGDAELALAPAWQAR